MLLHRIIGTAGHIDHGKSALVRALTGIDTDRLQEEKERGITIDLGFAHAVLGDNVTLSFVDVPGHERFVKNMLAGVGGIDAVLLVVAADESIMPQTREHFAICRLLGVRRGVVAITKCDLVDRELADLVELELHEYLADTFLASCATVRTSITDGTGLDALLEALKTAVTDAPLRPLDGPLRLPIDRVFSVHGFGTVVTGTVASGSITVGDRLELHPSRTTVVVRGLQVHGQSVERSGAGSRAAINLQGMERADLERGMVLATPGCLRTSHMVDVRLQLLPGLGDIHHLQRVRFHHGAAEVLGRVSLLDADVIPDGGSGLAQLRLEEPYPLVPDDRFIMRRYSPMVTIGGGIVIDAQPVKHRLHELGAADRLRWIEAANPEAKLARWVEEAGIDGIDGTQLKPRLGVTEAGLDQLCHGLVEHHGLVSIRDASPYVVDGRIFQELCQRLLKSVEWFHEEQPLKPGIPKEELRSIVARYVEQRVFDAALERLVTSNDLVRSADGIASPAHQVILDENQQQLSNTLLQRLRTAGLAPPRIEEILQSLEPGNPDVRQLYHHLVRTGKLVRVKERLVFHRDVIDDLIQLLRQRCGEGDLFSVTDFKDWIGVTRKHAIPLLEFLDAQRVTRRVGAARQIIG